MLQAPRRIGTALLAVTCSVGAATAGAQVVTYSAHDSHSGVVGPNSSAAQLSFLGATGGAVGMTFESALPTGVGVIGGTITNDAVCAPRLCGFNTTAGGQSFLFQYGQSATFTFATPIDYFGAYFGGVQMLNDIEFTDVHGNQVVAIPFSHEAGGSFVGFTSAGAKITSVTINPRASGVGDIITVDDVIFGTLVTSVPEPATWPLVVSGLAGLALAERRRRRA